MTHFRLSSDCFLVQGEKGGVIYDVHGGRLIMLDSLAYRLLKRCEDNVPLQGQLSRREYAFLELLQEADIGDFHDEPGYVDKLLLQQPVAWKGLGILPPDYIRVDWSITGRCDLECAFCAQGDEILAWEACQSCLRKQGNGRPSWLPQDLESFVAQIAALGTRILHLRGGNPLLEWKVLQRIVHAAQDNGLALVLTTPGIGADTERILELYGRAQLHLNIVLFGADEQQSRAVCGRAGILEQQLHLISKLLEARCPFSTTFLLTKDQRRRRQELTEFALRRWQGEPAFTEICWREDMVPGFRLSHVGKTTRRLYPWASPDEFFFRISHNGCTYGNFEIASDGRLYNCAGLNTVHADVARDGLRLALAQDSLYQAWELSKSKVTPCSGCALRIGCLDCSVFELSGQQDEIVREAYCPYCASGEAPSDVDGPWGDPSFVQVLRLDGQG